MKITITKEIEVPDDATHYSGDLLGAYDIWKKDQLKPRDSYGWFIWVPLGNGRKGWAVYSEEHPAFRLTELPIDPVFLRMPLHRLLELVVDSKAVPAFDSAHRDALIALSRAVEKETIGRCALQFENRWQPIGLVPMPKDGLPFDVWFWAPTGEGFRFEDIQWSEERQRFEHYIHNGEDLAEYDFTTETHWMRVNGPRKLA